MSLRLLLLLLTLAAPAAWAQAPLDDAALSEGIEATGDTAEVRALHAWASEHEEVYPEQAEQVARRALALARDLNDQQGIGQNLIILGHLTTNLNQAETYYTAAGKAFEQIEHEHGLISTRNNLGNVHMARGALQEALSHYFAALEGFERFGDTEGEFAVLNNIGLIHQGQGNLKEALAYYERAASLAESVDRPILLINLHTNLGAALVEQGSYEQGEVHFRRALAIAENRGYRSHTAMASNNLGFVLNKQGLHKQALPFLFAAEHLANEMGEGSLLTVVTDELGKAHMGLGQFDQALHYARESLTLAREAGSSRHQMEAHQTLSQIYEAAGDPVQALVHYRQYAAMRDAVFTTEKAEIVTEMQTRYETEEKQRAIERLEHENQIRLILFLTGVGGLLLLLGFLTYRYRVKQRANHLLEDLDRAKSRFFANISHEFRTPLTVILGGMQDMIDGRFDGNKKKLSEQQQAMLRNTRQLQQLVNEVLDLNRLEAGKLELKPAAGDLVRTLRRIVEADAPLAERNGIDLTFEHDVEQCPRLYDQEKLEKIVGNLLSNALKFTPEGGVVRVALRSGNPVEIAISDTGPGIPVEAQAKVFERFSQAGAGGHHGGTGIGLALAKELTDLHGGTITLDSKPRKGSTFTVRFPLETVSLDDVASTGLPRRSSTESGRSTLREGNPVPEGQFASGGDGHEKREDVRATLVVAQQAEETDGNPDRTTVLIIEDNDDVRAYVRRSLEETYRVLEAADGEAGLQQAREKLPDLIVSDVMLPGIDGYEVARRLKAEPDTQCIPVLMLTARAAEEDQTEGYSSGAEVYITKPFSPETLRAAVARLLEERLRLRRRLQEVGSQTEETEHESGEPTFSDHARMVALEHLYDEDFGAKELASALSMTRRTLYNRLQSEVGLSPSDFLRTLRLERARELLTNGAGSVSEVAYAVGFNSLSVFSRAYRTHYGTPPSAHLDREIAPS